MAEEIASRTTTEVQEVPKENKPEAPLTQVVPHNSLYEMFNVDKTPRNDAALAKIWDWATEISPNKDAESIKMTIISRRNRMASSPIGEIPYLRMEMYASAYFDMKKAEQRMGELERSTIG